MVLNNFQDYILKHFELTTGLRGYIGRVAHMTSRDKPKNERLILWFEELRNTDVGLVGGKNASLGEMLVHLSKKGVKIPNGFAITAHAYHHFIEQAGLKDFISEKLTEIRYAYDALEKAQEAYESAKTEKNTEIFEEKNRSFQNLLQENGKAIRERVVNEKLPEDLEKAIRISYERLCETVGTGIVPDNLDVAVRSSATAEDLPEASFAGQQDTFLNIKGTNELTRKTIECFASLFTNRAISYREDQMRAQLAKVREAEETGNIQKAEYHRNIANAIDHFNVGLSVGVQLMVRSDLAASGVMFTIDTESGFDKVVFINGIWGLGEYCVQGTVNPDTWIFFKPTRKIVDKKPGDKHVRLVYSEIGTIEEEVASEDINKFTLTDEEVEVLGNWAIIIEEHYGRPMDIEWAKDGYSGDLFIVQARPETVHSTKGTVLETYRLKEKGEVLVRGEAIGHKIGQGNVRIITDISQLGEFKPGEILVAEMTTPDYEPIMKVANAIVTDRGGRTCHAAIVSRELGVTCVIGTLDATKILRNEMSVTVDCSEGLGMIYEGLLPYEVTKLDLTRIPDTKTKIMLNIGVPENAFFQAALPHDGVGLAREEFIINSHIQIHPLALLNYDKLEDITPHDLIEYARQAKNQIAELTAGYEEDKAQFFVDRLAYGIGRIGAAFYPHDVIFRLSDFKSNEYANLIGGQIFEPEESNPMIGWRGCSRYYDKNYAKAFRLECKAFAKVRNEMGLGNVVVMYPFCRTPEEAMLVTSILEEEGLKRGEPAEMPLRIFCMAEIPSNVILADQFAEQMDGFSIGSNDLTQLTLGLDRDSELVAHIYDERSDSVKRMVHMLISTATVKGTKVGICGQAPSDFPSFAAFLIEEGIDSMSLNPDTLIQTKGLVYVVEKAITEGKKYEDINEAYIKKTLKDYPGLDILVTEMVEQERRLMNEHKRDL